MADAALTQALEDIYVSVSGNNENLDALIAALKKAMGDAKEVTIDTARLTYNNRESRNRMKAYFKKKGVIVNFINIEKPVAAA